MLVFDSSTIILLARIELLDALVNSYQGKIVIPEAVESETTMKNTFDALLIKKRIEEGKIKVMDAHDKMIETIMKDFNINQGESEAIFLALKNKGSILATDDKNAINACKLLQIPFTTAIGILLRVKEKNLLTKEDASLKLVQLIEYGRYKKEIINDAKRRLG